MTWMKIKGLKTDVMETDTGDKTSKRRDFSQRNLQRITVASCMSTLNLCHVFLGNTIQWMRLSQSSNSDKWDLSCARFLPLHDEYQLLNAYIQCSFLTTYSRWNISTKFVTNFGTLYVHTVTINCYKWMEKDEH